MDHNNLAMYNLKKQLTIVVWYLQLRRLVKLDF